MLIIGLTGCAGTGKSTIARMFTAYGVLVYDSDAAVHRLYAEGGAGVKPVSVVFPDVSDGFTINRQKLSSLVFGDSRLLSTLESIIHPLVQESERLFLRKALAMGSKYVLLDMPLLLETGHDSYCDYVVVTTVDAKIQRRRLLSRADMTVAKIDAILSRQMSDIDKRQRANFLIDTGYGMDMAEHSVSDVMRTISSVSSPDYAD